MFWEEFHGSVRFWLQNHGMGTTCEIQTYTAQHINRVTTLTLDLKPAHVDPTVQLSPNKHTGIYQANFQTL